MSIELQTFKAGDCALRDDQIVLALSMIDVSQVGAVYRDAAVELIKSQQSRIEVLESAIRKLINRKLDRHSNQVTKDQEVNLAIDELRNLMENKS